MFLAEVQQCTQTNPLGLFQHALASVLYLTLLVGLAYPAARPVPIDQTWCGTSAVFFFFSGTTAAR